MKDDLKPGAFFELTATAYGEFLGGFEWPWDPLHEIGALARELLRGVREGDIMAGAHVLGDDVDVGPGTVVERRADGRGQMADGRGQSRTERASTAEGRAF